MDEEAGIYAREFEYLDRYVQVGVASGRVLAVSFLRTPEEGASDEHELLDRIEAYLEGKKDDFRDVAIALTIPTDQQAIIQQVREIPYGEQLSVERLTRITPELDEENEDDLTLVRTALDENPAPLLIPDHRVRDGPSAAPPEIEQKLRSLEGL